MLYALMSLGSMRFGEAAARRWRDYDPDAKPLGKICSTSLYCVKTKEEKPVKTQAPREMPVHPALANMLATWKQSGWQALMGRAPTPDDLIVPSSTGSFRNVNRGLHNFYADLGRLCLRKRRQHDLRRTFISLARAGGARPDILRWVTHGPTGDIVDIYTTLPWETLCDAVSCVKIELVKGVDAEEHSHRCEQAPHPRGDSIQERSYRALQRHLLRSRRAPAPPRGDAS